MLKQIQGGSNLILLARRLDSLSQVSSLCSSVNPNLKISTIQFDVSSPAQIAGLWEKIPQDLKDIDILVNNAGYVVGIDRVGDIDEQVVEGMFKTNVIGLIGMTQLLVKR